MIEVAAKLVALGAVVVSQNQLVGALLVTALLGMWLASRTRKGTHLIEQRAYREAVQQRGEHHVIAKAG